MYSCSPYTISTPFMDPNSMKDDEETINQLNQKLVEKAKEGDVSFKIVKISKNQLDRMLKKEQIAKTQNKSCLKDDSLSKSKTEENSNLKKDWDELPQQVKEEVMKLTTQKQFRKCINNCPCKYTHGLVQLYHNAQLLHEKVEKIEAAKGYCKFQMSRSDDDFFKKDDSTCNILMKEMKTQKSNMKELRNIFEKVKEKLKLHSEEGFRNQKCLKELNKKMQQVDEITKELKPQGKLSPLKEEQQTIEIAFMNRAICLEEEEKSKAEEEIQMRLRRKEEWKEQEKCCDQKRCKERQTDTLLVLKSTNLMENYIKEIKAEISM